MTALLALMQKELRALLRDVHGLLVLFIMPAVFILIMSLALRDTFALDAADKLNWRYHDADASDASASLLQELGEATEKDATGRARAVADKAALESVLRDGTAQLGLQIAAGYQQALERERSAAAVLIIEAQAGTPAALVAAFQARVERAYALARARAQLTALTRLNAESEDEAETPDAAQATSDDAQASGENELDRVILAPGAVQLNWRHATQVPLTSVQQSVPAWLVFAMFFVVIPLSTIFIAERQHGTLQRLRSLQVPMHTVLLAKLLPFHAINLLQTVLMLLIGRYLVPALGGDALALDVSWIALWLMASAVSFAALAFALLIASFARTTEQATTIGGVANILLAALGGVMVPKLVMPAVMQQLTAFSPMAWGLDGFLAIFLQGAGALEILPRAAVLLVLASILFALTLWRLRREGR